MGISMIFMFLILVILYPLSFILFNFCEVMKIVIDSEAGYNTLDLGTTDITNKVRVCLWNTDPLGNIAASFNIDQ